MLSPLSSPAVCVLIIDNVDSNTYNIRETLGKMGCEAMVCRNNAVSMDQVRSIAPTHIILGPGPGTPENAQDVGICPEILRYAIERNIPLVGICLGQQIIFHELGGSVVRAPVIMHGKTSAIRFSRSQLASPDLFADIADDLEVMRYHSLMCDLNTCPPSLVPTAFLSGLRDPEDRRVIMALQHAELPIYGVQFHPESCFTQQGIEILRAFLKAPLPVKIGSSHFETLRSAVPVIPLPTLPQPQELQIMPVECELSPQEIYARLSHRSLHCYCLESREDETGDHRFSYIGFDPQFLIEARNEECCIHGQRLELADGITSFDVLEVLEAQLRVSEIQHDSLLLTGGLVGYFSYEAMQYEEPTFMGRTADNRQTFAFGYYEDGLVFDGSSKKYQYYTRGRNRLLELLALIQEPIDSEPVRAVFQKNETSKADFVNAVQSIKDQEIDTGNAQQVVLSRRRIYHITGSLAPLYQCYTSLFPASNMHAMKMGDVESVGSFPELMMRVQNGIISTIQLAGTRKRIDEKAFDDALFEQLITDEKELAEHRMLIDQARNDVGRSSILGSVREKKLMYRKDAGPVMHISSLIQGHGAPDFSPVRAYAHIAPMGTVSGAPKVRSTQIIHQYEHGQARNLYGGSVGFFDVTGNAEFVIGLRNIVRYGSQLFVQAGAGIVHDSVPEREYEETEQKMQAALTVLQPFLS